MELRHFLLFVVLKKKKAEYTGLHVDVKIQTFFLWFFFTSLLIWGILSEEGQLRFISAGPWEERKFVKREKERESV